ncbi:MAG: PH domain-containing protein [Thaumarchaeota archaeon]|nr:PH domain-containing protein [Nitrososphaerota archaeon]
MSLAGYSSDGGPEETLILRPTSIKTFLKGVIGVAVFSIFLQLSPANLVHYLIFLSACLGLLGGFVLLRRVSAFELGEDSIIVKRIFRAPYSISYSDIIDISVAQGAMARRFNSGTVFLILKGGRGGVRLMGGGSGEQLEEVHDPRHVRDIIAAKLSPFSSSIEP